MKRRVFFSFLFFFTAVLSSTQAQTPAEQKKIMSQVRVDQNLGKKIPLDVTFLDEKGVSVPIGNYFKDRPVLITPVYYECPMLCTITLTDLVNALKTVPLEPGKDFEILTFSINPKEGPELASKKKASYVNVYRRPSAAQGWHFMTGDQASIEKLTEALGFHYAYDAQSGQYAHASSVIAATAQGALTHYFTGVGIEPRDLRLALVEASRGKIGTVTDQILLLCYHYDPATGRYGFAIENAIRITGVLTAFILFAAIWLMIRSERKR
jgi:protein SCO1/2